MKRLPVPVIILAAASVPLWAILVTETCTPVNDRMLHLVQPAAPTLTIIAILLCAAGKARERERRMYERLRQMQERERVLIRVIDSMDAERPSPPLAAVP